jgi:hypothetical protein
MAVRAAQKVCYSEFEAAEALGIGIEELRSFVREKLARTPAELEALPVAWFQRSDLLLLSLIARGQGGPTLQDSADSEDGGR